MNQDTERIPVPRNGHEPTSIDPAPATAPPAAPQAVPLTPTQLAAGFGIVAGLLLLFVGARRRRGGKDAGE